MERDTLPQIGILALVGVNVAPDVALVHDADFAPQEVMLSLLILDAFPFLPLGRGGIACGSIGSGSSSNACGSTFLCIDWRVSVLGFVIGICN